MAKKKKTINRKSVQQQIWRLQNKLDQKRLPADKKRELELKLQGAKKKIGYEGATKREQERFSKERRTISSKKAKLNKILSSPSSSKKEINKARKEILALNQRNQDIGKYLGEKKKTQKVKKTSPRGERVDKGVLKFIEPVWVVRSDYLEPAIDSDKIRLITIQGEEFHKTTRGDLKDMGVDVNQMDPEIVDILLGWVDMESNGSNTQDIYSAWMNLEVEALKKGVTTPYVEIVFNMKEQSVEFSLDFS